MLNIFVSIINYNGKKDTLNCLKSLNEVNIKDYKLNVVVVDNGSKETFNDEGHFKNFRLEIIKSEENLGFSGGQNIGIRHSLKNNADYVVVLNNDVTVDKNLFIELLKTFELKKDAGLTSPKIYFSKGSEFHKDRYQKEELGSVIWYAGGKMDWENVIAAHKWVDEVDVEQYEVLEKTDFASGCCVMIKAEVFEKIGFFNEKYFLYYEDNDLCQRARERGFEVYYQPKAFMWHINASSAGGSGSSLQDYYLTRNRMLFGFKYAPIRAKFALFKESLRLLFVGRTWQKNAILDFYKGRFGKGSYNL